MHPRNLSGPFIAIAVLIMAGSLLGSCDFILPNKPPYIEKISPADSSVYAVGESVDFKVHAYDVDGSLIRVQFIVPGGETFNDPIRLMNILGTQGNMIQAIIFSRSGPWMIRMIIM